MIRAKIYVTLKPDVMDPQGLAVKNALESLNYKSVSRVSIGKYFLIDFDSPDRQTVEAELEKMCKQLLSNPVIENYRYQLEDGAK
jgi:phosphoribosylformylglycinamidine synthase PurS subunit